MSEVATQPSHTEHALLVLLGQYAQQLGLIQALMAAPLHQKTRTHQPQTKVVEFLVAILAGLPHLEDISRDARPLDQDLVVATAWQQSGWADYSGVGRALQALIQPEAERIAAVLSHISRPFIDDQVVQALLHEGRLIYDGDLTGRPVSNTSTSYPGAAFGHMDDAVRLGYQAAVVSLRSPTYGRLWLSVQPHPGNVLSCQVAQEMVRAAEGQTGVRPRRRTELLSQRLHAMSQERAQAEQRLVQRRQAFSAAQALMQARSEQAGQANAALTGLIAASDQAAQRKGRPHCRLAQVRAHLAACERRLLRQQQRFLQAQRSVEREKVRFATLRAMELTLRQRLEDFDQENAANPAPIHAVFRLDAGFGTWENVASLIELGYEVYTRPYSPKVKTSLLHRIEDTTPWVRVGANAEMIAWSGVLFKGSPYPVDVALEHFYPGKTEQYGALLHFGSDAVTKDLGNWFAFYNDRQTVEAGIKEGKGVFQMHHLKVRSLPALWLQEQFAAFAANFLRWAAHWLCHDCGQMPQQWLAPVTASIKTLVQVAAHTPATVQWLPNGCVLRFSDESLYAGRMIQVGSWVMQLSLPLFQSCHFEPISMTPALIAQNLR